MSLGAVFAVLGLILGLIIAVAVVMLVVRVWKHTDPKKKAPLMSAEENMRR